MFNLIFLFTGLCGFALDGQFEGKTRAMGLDVVLVEESHHRSVLIVKKSTIDANSQLKCNPTLQYVTGAYCGFELTDQIVSVRDSKALDDVTWTSLLDSERPCPSDDNKTSYGWVAPMSLLTPGKGLVRDDLRRPSRNPPSFVRAVIRLERGELLNHGFASADGLPIRWRLGRGVLRSKVETAMGDPVELIQTGWSGPIELEFRNMRSGMISVLKLKAGGTGNDRLVEVYNTLERDICAPKTYLAPKLGPSGTRVADVIPQNRHFEHLYDLLSDPVRSKPEYAGLCLTQPEFKLITGRCTEKKYVPYGVSNPQCPGADMSHP